MDEVGSPGTIARFSNPADAVLFQNVLPGEHWNQMGIVPLDQTDAGRAMLPFRCLRLHFAADRGLCLAEGGGLAGNYTAYIFDADLQLTDKVKLGGLPSRARVSPDGRYGAATSFVSGHSYAQEGFSTETLLVDLGSGDTIANLQEFDVFRDGRQIREESFNYWGVTFAHDSNRFYATLAFLGETHLVEGNIADRQVRLLHENVECPSLSPDNTRIAYKKQVGDGLTGIVWRFHVLDLATMTETPLAETRNIDDQMEWLENDRLLYGDGSDTWVVPADGGGESQRFMSQAISPTVIQGLGNPGSASPIANGVADGPEIVVLPEADLAVDVTVEPQPAKFGEQFAVRMKVTNHGPADATWLVVDSVLPAGATYVSAEATLPPGMDYGCGVYGEAGGVRCDAPMLATGADWTIVIMVKPDGVGTWPGKVTVDAAEADLDSTNDVTSFNVYVEP